MSKLTAGEVTITLKDGDDVLRELTLRPTLRVAEMLNAQFGNLREATQAILNLNLQGIFSIIRFGANLQDRELKTVKEQVYRNGMNDDLLLPLIRFVAIVQNGGRPPAEDPLAGDGDAGGGGTEGN